MNKQKFIEFIQQPDKLTTHNLSELDELVGENPYFQAARVLEAKGNRALKTKEAGRKTASAAIYSTNRILLKKYLAGGISKKGVVPAPKSQPIQEKPKPSSASPTQIPVTQPTVQTPIEPETPGTSSIDQLIYSLKKDMKELEVSRAKYIEVARKIEEEEAVENAVKKATESAELDITANRKANKPSEAAPIKETTEKKPKTSSKSKSTGTAKSKTTKKPSTSSKTKSAASTKSSTTKAGTTKKKPAAKKKTTKAAATKTTAKKTSAKKATTKSASTKSTAKKSTSRAPRSTKSSKTTKKDDTDGENQQQLIDQFIKKKPSFKPATEPKNQEDLSAKSTTLNEDLASEYLAEIFLEQGKKDKAIKIYNSLMLRFPEKKAYFAGRIKKIK